MQQRTVRPMAMRLPLIFCCATLLFLVSACSGIQQTEGQPRSDASTEPAAEEETADLSAFETFDPSMYAVEPPERSVTIEHTVPDRLMRGEASEGVQRTVEGFRIQVFSSQQKGEAERQLTDARDWWESVREDEEGPDDLFPEQLPAVIEYRQPYYRVRIGSFAEREQANRALEFVKNEYPDAFVARSTVTITR